MAHESQKQKFASTPNEALPTSSSTPQANSRGAIRQNARTSKKRKTRESIVADNVDSEEIHSATIFETPKSPCATLEGLPAEMRLEIYKHLSDS
jgi:hypothetical protein